MVKNIEELKNLIIWAKEQKIKVLKLADIHIELSDLALVESFNNSVTEQETDQIIRTSISDEKETEKQNEEDLYWSTR